MKRLTVLFLISCFAIFFTSEAKAQTSGNDLYKIGIDDVIQIQVLDHPNLRVVSKVSSDGTINFPYLGTVRVKDMNVVEIEQEITKQLSDGFVKFPVVSVTLTKAMSRKIYTYGAISRRGSILFEQDMTLMQAVSIAGGLSPDGQYGKLKVRRKQKKSPGYKDIEIDLKSMFENSNVKSLFLQPDDILIVERNRTFLVQGEAAKRGRFVLENDMTVLSALLEAGGVNANSKYGKIKIRRKKDGEPGGYQDLIESKLNDGVIENKEFEDTLLQPDDILIIERNRTFLVQGEAAKRGRFVLENNMTVLRALLEAGGVNANSKYGKIKIRRKKDGEPGGYQDLIESKLNDGVIENKEFEDTLLQADDIVIVKRDNTFFIYGEVKKTGEFVLRTDMTVFKAITLAGGFTKWGSGNRVKILRLTEKGEGFVTINVNIKDVLDGDATADIYLKHGDVIVVSTGIF